MRSLQACGLLLTLPFLAVLSFAQDSTAKERVKWLRNAGKQSPQQIPQITPYLTDVDADVRREAVKAIVNIGSQASLDPLVKATADNDAEVQIRAVDGLVNFYRPGYVASGLSSTIKRAGDAVTARFKTEENTDIVDPDTYVRPEIITAVKRVISGGASMESRANAARAAGILRASAAVPELTEALRKKDDTLILESLVALQKIGDLKSGERATFLVRDFNRKVQLKAIETVGLLKTKEAVGDLRIVLERDAPKDVRRAALLALAQIGDTNSRPLFLSSLNDKDDEIRAAAAEGLGRTGKPEDRAMLLRTFKEETKNSPRLAQCFAVVTLGDTEVAELSPLQYLVNNLSSKAWRNVSLAYLRELVRQPAPRAAVIQMLPSALKEEKIALADALSTSKGADALDALQKMSKDLDPEIASAALRATRILRAGK